MNSSGIKRGLATTAVAALAVTGLPFLASSASADAYVDQIASGDAVLYSQYSGFGSVQNDGTNTTIHLLAGGGSDVVQVRFEYSSDNGATWHAIETVSRSNGGFSAEWTPPTAIYNLGTVQVQAVPLNSVGTEIAAGTDSAPVVVGSSQPAVDIANAPGSTVPVFVQPYSGETATAELGVISGKTSDVSAGATVDVSNLTTGTPTGTNSATLAPAADGTRAFTGAVDFSGYTWDTTAPVVNQAVVGAESGSDDAELVNLTKQTITAVTATADPATVQGAGTSTGIVTVTDQNGLPVAGAQVFYDANNDGVHDAGETFKYTDANGQAKFPGLTGSASGTTHAFIVNTDDGDNYDPSADFRRTVTVSSYTPAATSITLSSHDGAAFDFDENSAGDITATVKDQNGNGLAGQSLNGKWTITAFTGGTPTTAAATITDNGDGTYNVAFPAGVEGTYKLDVWVEKDGSPGQSAGDLSANPLTVEAGEANVTWNDGATAQAPAGTTATFSGTITLDDGTALPNRNIAFSWTPTGNAVVAAQASQPAGTKRVSDNSATATANDKGEFGVAIADPAASPQPSELNGVLVANSATTPDYGTNTDNNDTLDVDFLADSAVDTTKSTTDQADLDTVNGATPGRPVQVSINVQNAAGTDLTDLPVTVETDHGFFTTPDATTLAGLKADPAASDGAEYGEWEDLGSTYETTTDDSGDAVAVVAIERDAGFDDDGQVTAKVTFTVGGKTFTEPVVFDSSNPLNGGEVTVTLDDTQSVQDSTLPNAPTTESLDWNVHATDQFGNLTDETISLSDNGSAADLSASSVTSNFTDDNPNLTTSSDVDADQVVSALWDNAPTTTWKDADTTTAGFQGDTDLADSTATGTKDITGESEAIHWYTIDFSASTYSLGHSGADTQPVGTTVTETYQAVDQHGEPIEGLRVTFYRTGPDDLQDGDGNSWDYTDSNGVVYYVFQGAKEGTATTTAVVEYYDGSSWKLIPQAEQTDTVNFGGTVTEPVLAHMKMKGIDKGKRDVIKLNAIDAASGAQVKLFKRKADGSLKRIKSAVLNDHGNFTFRVHDGNGNKFTRYTVKLVGNDAVRPANKSRRVR